MNITTVQEFKELIGKAIYAIPTGNAARGWKGEFAEFTVIGAKRKYVELQPKGWECSSEYDPKSGTDKQSAQGGYFNSGYTFFPTLESITEYHSRGELADKLNEKCGIYNNLFSKMSVTDLEAVIAILDKYEDKK